MRLKIYALIVGAIALAYEVYLLRVQNFLIGGGAFFQSLLLASILGFWALGNWSFQHYHLRVGQRHLFSMAIWIALASSFHPFAYLRESSFPGLMPVIWPLLAGSLFFLVGYVGTALVAKAPDQAASTMGAGTFGGLIGLLSSGVILHYWFSLDQFIVLIALFTGLLVYQVFSKAIFPALIGVGLSFLLNLGVGQKEHQLIVTGVSVYEVKETKKFKGLAINGNRFSSILDEQGNSGSYNNFIHKIFLSGPKKRDVLVLGAGGMSLSAKNQHHNYRYIDIDPKLKKLVQKSFRSDANEDYISQHGRDFLVQNKQRYDLIVLDIFSLGSSQIPFEFLSHQFFELVLKRLKDQGSLAFNIVHSGLLGQSRWTRRLQNTLTKTFGSCYFVPMRSHNFLGRKQVLVSSLAICQKGLNDWNYLTDGGKI